MTAIAPLAKLAAWQALESQDAVRFDAADRQASL